MKNEKRLMKNIEQCGGRYYKTYLHPWRKKGLEDNWWPALKFFFEHSFMRGRSDRLSTQYCSFAIETLHDAFSISDENLQSSYERLKEKRQYFEIESILKFKNDRGIRRGNSIKHKDFGAKVAEKNLIVNHLITKKEVDVKFAGKTYKKGVFLGNDADVIMVLDVLKFISDNEKKNIYTYVKRTIERSGVETAYKELTKIRAVSDKIATFFIRDVGLLNPGTIVEDFSRAFPVDTWVKKLAGKLGYKTDNIKEMKQRLIDKCEQYGIDPLKFAAGLWYLGSNSLNMLVDDCLEHIELGSSTSMQS